jgi:hypothetical protein
VVGPAGYAPTFTSFRDTNVTGYTGGLVQLDLGSLPAGDYALSLVVGAEVSAGVSPPEPRDLFCVLDTIPASPLVQTAQVTFPSLNANGNAFVEMPMVATSSFPNGASLRLRCELSPTTNSPNLRLTARMIAVATSSITQL